MKRTPRQYAELLYALTVEAKKSEIDLRVQRFVSFLVRERATQYLPRIIANFEALWNERHAIQSVEIATARPLSAHLRDTLEGAFKDKKIIVSETIDQKFLGGIRIRFDDTIIDGTAHNLLEHLRIELSSP